MFEHDSANPQAAVGRQTAKRHNVQLKYKKYCANQKLHNVLKHYKEDVFEHDGANPQAAVRRQTAKRHNVQLKYKKYNTELTRSFIMYN